MAAFRANRLQQSVAVSHARAHGHRCPPGAVRQEFHSEGHVFNPLSVFWCYDGCGRLAAVVAEVHNTYGERHAYLLHPDDTGFAVTRKAFHVSPFFDVSGSYELRLTLRPDGVSTVVALRRDGAIAFVAGVWGSAQPATRRAVARLRVRRP